MEDITFTKKEWQAINALRESDRDKVIIALFENSFEDKEPDFEEWRREELTAIFNLLKVER